MAEWQHPFDTKTITSRFGETDRRGSPHRGTDYAPGSYNLIPAITKGTVVATEWSDCLGWYMVQTAWAKKRTWYIGYSHLACNDHGINCKGPKQHRDGSNNFVNLKVGDKLEFGQWVGRVGNTGKCSRGAHAHVTLSDTQTGVIYGEVLDIAQFIDALKKKEVCKCCQRPL
jgi:murein DD-endopeptidase MepM/ murein hydrolase activator NlpD